jgi:hypothetical protein
MSILHNGDEAVSVAFEEIKSRDRLEKVYNRHSDLFTLLVS